MIGVQLRCKRFFKIFSKFVVAFNLQTVCKLKATTTSRCPLAVTQQRSNTMKKPTTKRMRAKQIDPVFGQNWDMNTAASVFTAWRPDSETRLYEQVGQGYKLTVTGTRNGQPYKWGYTATTDGKPCPVHGRPDVDMIVKHVVNNLITVGSFTKDGKIVAEYRRATSQDGKELTVVVSGRAPEGGAYFDVLRYERAEA